MFTPSYLFVDGKQINWKPVNRDYEYKVERSFTLMSQRLICEEQNNNKLSSDRLNLDSCDVTGSTRSSVLQNTKQSDPSDLLNVEKQGLLLMTK